ncbi:MAG: anhydro-N-acetylmuramic acid kinase [Hyphomicrobiaceae bacterium]
MAGATVRALGLMSGTSLDGIDIALVETDGETRVRRGPSATVAYPPDFRARLRTALTEALAIVDRADRPGSLADVERELTERHAEAVLRFIGNQALQPSAVDVVGFHGQTVLHRPERRLTVQIGDGALLARLTGIDVVDDLRAADCAAGGQGAPLVPVYHRALAGTIATRPLAVLNIGGVANVTWIGRDGTLVAFDTGPGNALMDDWALRHTGIPVDTDGAMARSGTADTVVLARALQHSYFGRPAPKSLDRNDFRIDLVEGLPAAAGAATLLELTVRSIAKARDAMPEPPALWIVAGGGRRNRALMERLATVVEAPVTTAETHGWNGDSMEAEAWAYLAVRARAGLPITFPGTTGVPRPLTGGVYRPSP